MNRPARGVITALIFCFLVALAVLVSLIAIRSRSSLWLEGHAKGVAIKYALADYRSDYGRYPNADEGLGVLLEGVLAGRQGPRYFKGHYLANKSDLLDPWGKRITFAIQAKPRQGCIISSLGRDGKYGGHGDDEDIILVCIE